jgi:uncharacterized protein involved in response to NO
MNTNVLLLLQGVAAAVSFVNAGLAAALPASPNKQLVVLTVGAIAAAFSVVIQNIGNKTTPK